MASIRFCSLPARGSHERHVFGESLDILCDRLDRRSRHESMARKMKIGSDDLSRRSESGAAVVARRDDSEMLRPNEPRLTGEDGNIMERNLQNISFTLQRAAKPFRGVWTWKIKGSSKRIICCFDSSFPFLSSEIPLFIKVYVPRTFQSIDLSKFYLVRAITFFNYSSVKAIPYVGEYFDALVSVNLSPGRGSHLPGMKKSIRYDCRG